MAAFRKSESGGPGAPTSQDEGWKWVGGSEVVCPPNLTLPVIKRYFFVIEKCVEDVKQDEKNDLDLLESIIRPTDPVKEELRQKTTNMSQFRPNITKIRVSTFWIPEI